MQEKTRPAPARGHRLPAAGFSSAADTVVAGEEGSPGNSNGPWVNGSSLLIAVCGPKSSTTCSNSLGDPYVCVQVRIYGIAGRSPQKNQ